MNWFARFWRHDEEGYEGAPSLPDGVRAYAVGDIHGQLDLLEQLLAMIEADDGARNPAQTITIFLGDLIDRGPDSRGVVELLQQRATSGARMVFLSGNHEEVLLRILRGEDNLVDDWLSFGGSECAESYGLDPKALAAMRPSSAGRRIRDAVPEHHRRFLEGFADSFMAGDYLFVHAGIRPGVAIEDQSVSDLRWIRRPFLDWPGRHKAMVVHGHTVTDDVDESEGRIGIDTGAYRSGVLTALGLEAEDRWVIQSTRRPSS